MAFTLPIFNLTCNVWHPPAIPPAAPDLVPVCQFYVGSKGLLDIEPGVLAHWVPPIYLRVPMGTDVRIGDLIEVTPGTGFLYYSRWVERTHLGFPNEYLTAILEQFQGFPPPPPPPPGAPLLDEASFDLLDEAGGVLLGE